MSRRLISYLLVLVGLPVVVGLVLGANQTRAGAQLPWLFSILYWVALSVSTWWLMAGGTWSVGRLLRPWLPPYWLIWILGGIAGSFVARPVIYQFAFLFRPWMETGNLRAMPPIEFSGQFALYYVTNWSVVLVMWVAAQGVLKFLLSPTDMKVKAVDLAPIMQTSEAELDQIPAPITQFSGFLERLPPFLGRDIIALHAEDHYLRVYTKRGDGLVLVTISEAIRTLEVLGFDGLQVHRSWWLSTNSVRASHIRDRKTYAVLENGIQVPISQTYRALFDKMIMVRHSNTVQLPS